MTRKTVWTCSTNLDKFTWFASAVARNYYCTAEKLLLQTSSTTRRPEQAGTFASTSIRFGAWVFTRTFWARLTIRARHCNDQRYRISRGCPWAPGYSTKVGLGFHNASFQPISENKVWQLDKTHHDKINYRTTSNIVDNPCGINKIRSIEWWKMQ